MEGKRPSDLSLALDHRARSLEPSSEDDDEDGVLGMLAEELYEAQRTGDKSRLKEVLKALREA